MKDKNQRLFILNPINVRNEVWQIDKDIPSRADCPSLRQILSPHKPAPPKSRDFWRKAAQYTIEELEAYFSASDTQEKPAS